MRLYSIRLRAKILEWILSLICKKYQIIEKQTKNKQKQNNTIYSVVNIKVFLYAVGPIINELLIYCR